ncbi:FtsK/SpoIIIE domain-containing protein [Microbacterium arborescens]|uniref:FtsK/SpoIIIE domain-containing protein n=1 Tax=Microbacterium arborescens TaxID=33883 RepID=UPI0027802816|nr:FtsK/SpoIIIE domain-containing protein [Microbacterium arborescens]MDQ1215539.1 S-DNA-T family DNA segregation ATPase FtsK/SpoIIIE [Microbacterium arborescens]
MHPTVPFDDPIRLPTPHPETRRPPLPVWALMVPVAGAVVLWQLTGSPTVLWFAALGPLVAVASVLDGVRVARRERRRSAARAAAGLRSAHAELEERHAHERADRWRATPDVARLLAAPDDLWRPRPSRDLVVVGSGDAPSRTRVEGAAPPDFRQAAATVRNAPVTVPLTAGIAIVGPAAPAASIARALVVQICLVHGPGEVSLVAAAEDWARELPHASVIGGLRLWWGRGMPPADADIAIVCVDSVAPPPQCAALVRVTGVDEAVLGYGGSSWTVRPESVGRVQATTIVALLRERAATVGGEDVRPLPFDDLPHPGGAGLTAVLGAGRGDPMVIDLVDDGPHAVVVGATGSGKSELLVTWIAALARALPPSRVNFLLIDFKGGRAFDALTSLPHVAGVVTDLDDRNAVRAIESLAAEVRRRERVLAELGARDIAEASGALPRLVVVVDEYAALTAAHPAMHDLFADIAARGRALGMHLVLATQRAAGFREAVLANAPLRIALRVADGAESRAVLGSAEAAALPGGRADRGAALVRRPTDAQPHLLRVSLCPPEAIAAIARDAAGGPPARRPWLPPLPDHVPLADVRREGALVLGLADEPAEQRRHVVVLDGRAPGAAVLGRAGSGRTTLLRTIAAQVPADRLCWVPDDLEAAWDVVTALDHVPEGWVVVVDDLDRLLAALPDDYSVAAAAMLERVARDARARRIQFVCAAQRIAGAVGRIVDLLPDRAVLAAVSRSEHVAFGGDPSHHDPSAPAGRGRWGRSLVQFADPGDVPPSHGEGALPDAFEPRWATAFVAPPTGATQAVLDHWRGRGLEVTSVEQTTSLQPGRVVWGTPEAWIGRWRGAAAGAQTRCQLVVDAACATELRLVTGSRLLPPYAVPGRGRAWVIDTRTDRVRRVVLPLSPALRSANPP